MGIVLDDPITLFQTWFERARSAGIPLPEAAALSTATSTGIPSSRMVLVKHMDDHGFVFYTNYGSRKARELDTNPHASLVWHWVTLEQQVRVDGTVIRVPPAESDAYFQSRPLASRIGAWASRQSEEQSRRSDLENEVSRYAAKFGNDVPRPGFWGGYRLTPTRLEFWEGRPDRLHDRVVYMKTEAGWDARRLDP